MKIKEGFVLRKVAAHHVILPIGKASVNFDGMVSVNETGVLLWNVLEKGGDRDAMVDALLAEYDVDRETATLDVDEFIDTLTKSGCIE